MKKMISILLCVIFCFACFAPAAFAADQKTIKVATNVAFPPYEYYEDEKAVGIDVDIMQAICDKLGYEMELSDMEFGSIITAVASGKIDVGFGAITITEERAKSVHFTTSYSTGIQSIIVNSPSSSRKIPPSPLSMTSTATRSRSACSRIPPATFTPPATSARTTWPASTRALTPSRLC